MEIGMRREEEVRLTHSGIFAKDGRRCVSVRFERGRDVAEAILPACRVTKNEGFTDEEVRGLEQYLESKNDEIFAKAKEINPIGEFFKCHLCLLLIAAMLVAAALPNGVRESGPLDSVKRMGQTGGQEFCPDRKQTGTMVASPNEERPEVEAAGRELSEAHVIETLRQKSAYRYRNVQQLRLLVWLLECGLAGLLGALFLLAGRERGQQWELIPSGRRIVAYIRRADGKKNGLVSSIK